MRINGQKLLCCVNGSKQESVVVFGDRGRGAELVGRLVVLPGDRCGVSAPVSIALGGDAGGEGLVSRGRLDENASTVGSHSGRLREGLTRTTAIEQRAMQPLHSTYTAPAGLLSLEGQDQPNAAMITVGDGVGVGFALALPSGFA